MEFELTYSGLFLGCLLSATIIPFASEALFLGVLYAGGDPYFTLLMATLGNFTGSLITYFMGYSGDFHHLERWFRVKPEKVEKMKIYVDKYGVWAAFLTWIPFIGDPLTLVLGFFRVNFRVILPIILLVKYARYHVLLFLFFGK